MNAKPGPFRLRPKYLAKDWGGRRLEALYRRELPAGAAIGESWELYDRPDGESSVIDTGPWRGRALASLRGARAIPLLTKILDATRTLSVQVHPDDEAAHELDSEAKTEAWYVVEAMPDARIYKGLREGVRAPDLLRAVNEGRVPEVLHSFAPAAGDVVFLPAGTVHAVGGGLVLYEVQQNADTTYRLYDWGRDRPVQIREAMRCADFAGRGADRVEPRLIEDDGHYRRSVRVSSRWFTMEEHEATGIVTLETERAGRETWHVLFVLEGNGEVRPFTRGVESVPLRPGDSVLLPSEHTEYEVEAHGGRALRFLLSFVP